MTTYEVIAILLAGVGAGIINVVVGSGTLITFPALVAIGVPPVTANVSNTIGLVPGSLAGAVGYRRELAGQRRRALSLLPATMVGGLVGALMLLWLPAGAFEAAGSLDDMDPLVESGRGLGLMVGLSDRLDGADLAITGEGSFDEQSLGGKTPMGVVKAAAAHGIPTVAVCGRSLLAERQWRDAGFAACYSTSDLAPDAETSMREAAALLRTIGREIAANHLAAQPRA